MGDRLDIGYRMTEAGHRWPGIALRRKTAGEAAGPCPWCGGADRFVVFSDGGYMCRQCGRNGWLDEENAHPPTPEQLQALRLAAIERRLEETERRLSALEAMHKTTDHLTYHSYLAENEPALDHWLKRGLSYHTIHQRQVGYCPACPTYRKSPSYTIPVTYRGQVFNIRHRLINPDPPTDKYRPHLAGLPAMLFNADALDAPDKTRIVIAEGEIKTMVLAQESELPVVGVMGTNGFNPAWASKLDPFKFVYVLYDPDAEEKAAKTAALFGNRGRVVTLPADVDDFFVKYGGTPADLGDYMRYARRCD